MYTGLPNFRFKLPSRNWMIFWTITASFTGALIYDRREKKSAQRKWSNLVAHLAHDTLPPEQMRRKLTIFLAAPPGDGLRAARQYFKEYVKPVLVSAALDYEVIEGRREGDVRAALAEKIRKHRRTAGEPSSVVEEPSVEKAVAETRQKMGIHDEPGPKGDIVIGRHTWKEYIRGLHEGWLGPLDPPPPPPAPPAPEEPAPASPEKKEKAETGSSDDASPVASSADNKEEDSKKSEEEKKKAEDEKSKPTGPIPAYISPAEYSSRNLPATLPSSFEGSVPVPFPHLLGFLNTPIRIYRFLTQRYLADSVGRDVAAIVLASAARPYQDGSYSEDPNQPTTPTSSDISASPSLTVYEQQTVLEHEEQDWNKSAHKRVEGAENKEREWIDDIVLDPRLASRMRRYVLPSEEEARAERIAEGKEWVLGEEMPAHVPVWKRLWIKYGYGESEEEAKKKPIIGNIDEED